MTEGCFSISFISSGSSLPALFKIFSGIPILPISCNNAEIFNILSKSLESFTFSCGIYFSNVMEYFITLSV